MKGLLKTLFFLHLQVESSCNEYNDLAQLLKLIPSTAQYACGVDYELSSRHNARDKFTDVVKVHTSIITHFKLLQVYVTWSYLLVVTQVISSLEQI